jgi:hypothetical protein
MSNMFYFLLGWVIGAVGMLLCVGLCEAGDDDNVPKPPTSRERRP